MDTDNIILVSGNRMDYENGVHEQLPGGEEGAFLENVNGIQNGTNEIEALNGDFESGVKLNDNGVVDLSAEEGAEGSNVTAENNGSIPSKDDLKHSELQNRIGKAKNGKTSSSKKAGTKVKESSSLASESQVKQPFALRTRSTPFNDRQVTGSKTKPTPALDKAHLSKQSRKADAPSSTMNAALPEGLTEKIKLKPVKKAAPNNAEGSAQSSSFILKYLVGAPQQKIPKPKDWVNSQPTISVSGVMKEPRNDGRLFYSKLEEKIHAKEVEKSTLQAKTKVESQEAELKMLRKSLTFKATPMPNFYQEPPPPKADLKKVTKVNSENVQSQLTIPTTRPKSPKLGRKKNSPTKDTEGTSGHTVRPSRLSLDEKVSQNNPTKGPSSFPVKKPIRKSLPKLPSQKTSLTRERVEPAAHKPTVSSEPNEPAAQETALSSETNELVFDGQVEPARATEPSEAEPNTNYVHIGEGEGEGETMLVEEPIEQ
ncbi:hypothetical protein LguiB_027582 [Lonicera macranthoides]